MPCGGKMVGHITLSTGNVAEFVKKYSFYFVLLIAAAILFIAAVYLSSLLSLHGRQNIIGESGAVELKNNASIDVNTGGLGANSIGENNGANNPQPAQPDSVASDVQLTVNGQEIPLPDSGTVSQNISSNGDNTLVEVTVNRETSGSTKNTSGSTIRIQSDTHSTTRYTNLDTQKEVSR